MLRFVTNLFRVLSLLVLLVIVMINAAVTLKVSPAVSAWLVFALCISVELAMLCQTVMNREENTCRQNYGYKLLFVSLLMMTTVLLLLINLF